MAGSKFGIWAVLGLLIVAAFAAVTWSAIGGGPATAPANIAAMAPAPVTAVGIAEAAVPVLDPALAP